MPIKEDKTVQVSSRINRSLVVKLKAIGKPGTIVSATINQFFKVKNSESSLEPGTTISGPDESMILTSHNKNQILLTVTKGEQSIVLNYDHETTCHLILKLTALVNIENN
jgi:hypothetical protein